MPEARERRTIGTVLNKLIERVNSNIRRLRIIEQELSIYKTRTNSVEEEILNQRNHINKVVAETNSKINQLDERVANMEMTIKEIIEQLKKVTTTTRIKELEQMIEIYNPIKSQFVTRDEVYRIVEEKLRE